jgi:predicted nucleotide-binding protein
LDKMSAESLIQQRIAEGEELHKTIMRQSEADGWANKVEHSVRRVVNGDDAWAGRFFHVRGGVSRDAARSVAMAQEAVERTLRKLESLIDIIRETDDPVRDADIESVASSTVSGPFSDEVFIVHGHDEGPREAVARFLTSLGLRPIILHEQASRGQTVIEKVEAHGDVGFAVVLLTPDDVGGLADGELAPRARQNVILELGYFIGRLGRGRVCALRRAGVEVPSDFNGVVYVELAANDAWKIQLARELREAGYSIDWNKVMA